MYIANFCETRKIKSNAIRLLFLLLNFWKSGKYALNLGALKIIFQRGCALNNYGQKLFELGCALNWDIYGTYTYIVKIRETWSCEINSFYLFILLINILLYLIIEHSRHMILIYIYNAKTFSDCKVWKPKLKTWTEKLNTFYLRIAIFRYIK